jgi:hypothetical protein
MKTNNIATGITGHPVDENGNKIDVPEIENYYICKACGQSVDMRDLGQVFHHEQKDHKPLELDA